VDEVGRYYDSLPQAQDWHDEDDDGGEDAWQLTGR
jgi:S-DNA-T family DNA segregation ATPase FtsK/SpoIIIE